MWTSETDVLSSSGLVCACSLSVSPSRVAAADILPDADRPSPIAALSLSVSALLPTGAPKWGGMTPGGAAVVTYSFMTNSPSYAFAEDRNGFAAMNEAQKAAARNAFAAWTDVANLTFIEVNDAGSGGVIRLGTNDQDGSSAAYAYYPGRYGSSGDIYLANDYAPNLTPTLGTYGYLTLLHEIGHAIGLKHPGDYNASGGGTGGPYLPAAEDSYQYSLMSYNSHPSLGMKGLPVGPALYDIAAIQYLYGANNATRTGNDVYQFNDPANAISRSIWDAGGIDTIDTGAQITSSIISLVAGTFSSIGPNGKGSAAVNNISIANGVILENAIGGRGHDMMIGNHADNVFTGGLGNDTIHGGAGTDTAVFSGSRSGYRWTKAGETTSVTGQDGADILIGVESLRFADGTFSLNPGPEAGPLAVYRFYNMMSGTHFYTASAGERDAVQATLPQMSYEGAVFNASDAGTSVWRFFNTNTGTHFYTISLAERDWVQANLAMYRFEGEAYKASASAQSGLDPLYRFYNEQTGTHFYTASATEASAVEVNLPQLHREGTAYYVDLV